MKVGDEYRIQTEESAAWNDDFLSQRSQLANETYRIEAERDERIRQKFSELVGKPSLFQGSSKESRNLCPVFDEKLPADSDKKVCLWIRDGWSIDDNSVRVDARLAGNQSPTIFIFIPKRNADDLRHQLIEYKAAAVTLEKKGVSGTSKSIEQQAMETTKQSAERKINDLLEEVFSEALVFQGGGTEVTGNNFREKIFEAAEKSLQRLYSQFDIADHPGWEKVYSRAKQGSPDALKAVGYEGEPAQNPVCKAILGFLTREKKGADIRNYFESSPYGWSQDAVEGGLQVLLIAGLIRVQGEHGQVIDPKELERKLIRKMTFRVETATVSAEQRIQVRKLLLKLGCKAKSGEELSAIPEFLEKMQELANLAGGEPPKPPRPDTSALSEIRRTAAGNEQILALFNKREEIGQQIDSWQALAGKIEQRWPVWLNLKELLRHAGDIKTAQEARQQAEAIIHQRLLLIDPDPIQPLLRSLADTLRQELNVYRTRYSEELARQNGLLGNDASWRELAEDERQELLHESGITETPNFTIGTSEGLIQALEQHPISVWNDRIHALSSHFDQVRELSAKASDPEVQAVDIPRRTIKTEADIQAWLKEVEAQLKIALAKGPVLIK